MEQPMSEKSAPSRARVVEYVADERLRSLEPLATEAVRKVLPSCKGHVQLRRTKNGRIH